MSARLSLLAATVTALAALSSAAPAFAECKTMGFTVNDYGKDGPTKDAKELLDKDITKWAADTGIQKYSVGKKTVKCELFLDVILFDEHTCTASASVCWGNDANVPAAPAVKSETAAKKSESKTAKAADRAPVETGAIKHSEEAPKASTSDDAPAKIEEKSESTTKASHKPETSAKLESGSDTKGDAAERAAAAAERAAAAAERAAAAAEKAAANNAPAAATAADKSAANTTDASRQIAPHDAAPKP